MPNTLATNEPKAISEIEPPEYEIYMFDISGAIVVNEDEYQAVMTAFTAGNTYLKLNKRLLRLDSIKLIQPRTRLRSFVLRQEK